MTTHPNPSRRNELRRQVADARRDVAWYERRLKEAKTPVDKDMAERALAKARSRLANATAALEAFK